MDKTRREVKIGSKERFSKTLTAADLAFYGGISGNFSALNTNEEYARGTEVGGRAIYELAVASLASTAVARLLGPTFRVSRYELDFLVPVRIGDTVVALATAVDKSSDPEKIICEVECLNQKGEVVVKGKVNNIRVGFSKEKAR